MASSSNSGMDIQKGLLIYVYLKYESLLCNAHFFENNFQFIEIKSLSKDPLFNSEVQCVQVKLLG